MVLALIFLVAGAVEETAGDAAAADALSILFFYCMVLGVAFLIFDSYLENNKNNLFSRLKRRLSSSQISNRFEWLIPFLPYILFALLSLAILSNLLLPGYVLVTDMVFGPIVPAQGIYTTGVVLGGGNALTAFSILLGYAIPGWAVEKLYLFLVFFLSASSMYRLTGRVGGPARYYAALLYAVNPFVYVRILSGALGLALAYSILPLAFLYFIRLLRPSGRKLQSAALPALLFSLTAVFDIHTFVLLVGLSLLYFIVWLFYNFRDVWARLRHVYVQAGLFIAFTLALNVYWIYSARQASGQILGSFTFLDAVAFASRPTLFGNTMFSIMAMYGFFRTGYLYPVDLAPWLIALLPLFIFLALYGFLAEFRNRVRGPVATTMIIAMVISVVLATGISSPLTAPIYTFLYNNLPLFNGFREAQKFVALLVLSYAFLGYFGLLQIEQMASRHLRLRGSKHSLIAAFAVLLIILSVSSPLLYTYMELGGFDGQLNNVMYPHSWYVARSIIESNVSDNSVLFLPWHTYMFYNWSGTLFASPFSNFFPGNLIYGGQDTYLGGQGAQTGFASGMMLQILKERNSIHNLGNLLSLMDVKYVFLSKSADFYRYGFLYSQHDLRLLLNTSTAALFLNLHPVYRAYVTDQLRTFSSFSYLVNLSSSLNLLDYAWIYGGNSTSSVGEIVPVSTVQESPVHFNMALPGLISVNSSYYLVFIPPAGANTQWSIQAGRPLQINSSSPGIVNAVSGGPSHIAAVCTTYEPALEAYAVSIAALVTITALVFWEKRR